MPAQEIARRYAEAQRIAREAGALALEYFRHWDRLAVETKGHQDFVSEADKNVELKVRAALAEAFPDDGIVGEEGAPHSGTSGFTWVIDPIDGTTNFINGIPQWCVILACVRAGRTEIGVVHDPVHDEMHHARRGGGAFCNAGPIHCATGKGLGEGSVGVGFSGRTPTKGIKHLINALIDKGGIFWRNGSGGLSLAYVASGRILGYLEEHMNAWDYLAGQLIVVESGGRTEPGDADVAIAHGGRVVVGAADCWDDIARLADGAYA
ncbi:inositol monophosphatase family protein [Phaeovulum sp.]|uniref:inositol monophosphatase family protein n=1 Tax=Phaeovulum sp. TaxID=2934796 RepID=UPI0039E4307E